eukprot:5922037-Pleurochrysis_carterae.AAC.1
MGPKLGVSVPCTTVVRFSAEILWTGCSSASKNAEQSALCGMYLYTPKPADWYCQLVIGRICSPRTGARSVWTHNKRPA